jgi:hypothetical protein
LTARRGRHARPAGETKPKGGKSAQRREAHTTPSVLFTVMVIASLLYGWLQRDSYYLSPETGLGYWLGIIGGSLMLLLLLYPVRKRVRFMRRWGSVRGWFQLHMVLGVVGPVLVMFHSNFELGSTNSTLALSAMLAVAFSGLVGRYLYSRIHHGLYGRRAELAELDFESASAREPLIYLFDRVPELKERLERLGQASASSTDGLHASLRKALAVEVDSRKAYGDCIPLLARALRVEAQRRRWSRKTTRDAYRAACRNLVHYLDTVRRVAQYECFVRLFGLWHVLHLPLFILLIVTALVHVLAVHMY